MTALIPIDMAHRAQTDRQASWLANLFMRHSQFVNAGAELYRGTSIPILTGLARRGLVVAFDLTYGKEFFVLTEAGRAYIEAHFPKYVELRRLRADGDQYAWGGSPSAEAVYDKIINRPHRVPPHLRNGKNGGFL